MNALVRESGRRWCGHAQRGAWALLLLGALTGLGCTRSPLDAGTSTEPGRVDIRLRLRASCGFDTAQYNTECFQALLFIIHVGTEERRVCEVLNSPPENIQRLAFAGAPQIATGALTSDGEVYFEVIGLHNKSPDLADAGPQALCDDADNFDNQLFFGTSDTLDLRALERPDAGPVLWEIPIDCRDCEQGCLQLGSPTCPTNPISFCVPGSANLLCEKPCQDPQNQDCFEGAMTCDLDEGRCEQDSADLGGFCQVCMSDDDCLHGDPGRPTTFCVGLPGQVEGMCAYRCPQNRCPGGARCNRLGNRLRRIGVELTPDTDGGVPLDAGQGGGHDGGRNDAGASDAGPTDAGPGGGSPTDAGPGDSGHDAGPNGVGPVDGGQPDGGPVDGGS